MYAKRAMNPSPGGATCRAAPFGPTGAVSLISAAARGAAGAGRYGLATRIGPGARWCRYPRTHSPEYGPGPPRWATNVGEGGALLSRGERQRVSIARALLKNAPVVLLDEVSSALDPVNEAAVHEGIERLMAGRTVVMVVHRLRTVQRADRIVFLDGGRIVEAGSHDELLCRGGRYADFWNISMTSVSSE